MQIVLAGGGTSGNAAWCDDLTMSTVNVSNPPLTWGQSSGFDGFGNLISEKPTAGSAPNLNMTLNTATNQLTGTGIHTQVAVAALNAAATDEDPINVFTFSGGTAVLAAALMPGSALSDQARGGIAAGLITYVSPGSAPWVTLPGSAGTT